MPQTCNDIFDLAGARLLIYIVAYNAEKTISQVLNRIPASLHQPGVEVLVIDDSSRDKTFSVGRRTNVHGLQVTILRNPVNQGYGGNQKLGYRYAIENGFDIVALVHGDGQYAPEKLPELLQPLIDDQALSLRIRQRGVRGSREIHEEGFIGFGGGVWIDVDDDDLRCLTRSERHCSRHGQVIRTGLSGAVHRPIVDGHGNGAGGRQRHREIEVRSVGSQIRVDQHGIHI